MSGAIETVVPRPEEAAALLRASLSAFGVVRFAVTGECMRPLLASGDVVQVADAAAHVPRFGDVVLVASAEGPRLHRLVFSLAGRIRTRGDQASGFDGPRRMPDALGTVLGVERGSALVPVFSPRRAVASLIVGLLRRLHRAARAS